MKRIIKNTKMMNNIFSIKQLSNQKKTIGNGFNHWLLHTIGLSIICKNNIKNILIKIIINLSISIIKIIYTNIFFFHLITSFF